MGMVIYDSELRRGGEGKVHRQIALYFNRCRAATFSHLFQVDEVLRELAVGGGDNHATGDAQVAIEPRMPEPSAVALHVQLRDLARGSAVLGAGLDAEVGGIGVAADDLEAARVGGGVGAADTERYYGGGVASVVVLSVGLWIWVCVGGDDDDDGLGFCGGAVKR